MDRDDTTPDVGEREGRPDAWSPKAVAGCLRALLIPGLVLALLVLVAAYVMYGRVAPSAHRSKSEDNVAMLVVLHHELAMTSGRGRAPPVGGKAFVLWPLAAGQINPDAPGALEVFFSPADDDAPEPRPIHEFRALTTERLLSGADVRHLTSYVGRRYDPAKPVSVYTGEPKPLIADLHFEDGALVGYSNGRVTFLTRAELGLAPGDPIVAGPASKSPILRELSE